MNENNQDSVSVYVNDQLVKLESPATLLQVFAAVGNHTDQEHKIVGALADGEMVDLSRSLQPRATPYRVEFIDTSTEEGMEILRHSTSHLMTQAIKRIFGRNTQLGVGPATKTGFYQDYDLPELSDNDLPKIEAEMHKIVAEANDVVRMELSKQEALDLFAHDELKRELIREIPSDTVTVYRQSEHYDLCRGPHVPNSSMIGAFKLMHVSGAYWRGDARRKRLKRIYGIAAPTEQELHRELTRREEARRRDHRKLGAELGLFVMTDLAPGAPVFLPDGTIIYNKLIELKRELMRKYGYLEIRTPTILNRKLWEISGHWDHYRQNMFTLRIENEESEDEEGESEGSEGEDYAVKPMNCPGSTIAYRSRPRSYRELPLRLGEFGYVHRNELSGVLMGLLRVRAFTQDDAHLYVRPDQIESEVSRTIQMFQELYSIFGFKAKVAFSTRPDNRMGDESLWDKAESALVAALKALNVDYDVMAGEGAFYGPKIDFHIEDCIGRQWQCGTCQLDFQLPEKFGLSYTSEDGKPETPVILHPTAMGSIERFMAICIEEFVGRFPTWLSPMQVLVLPISEKVMGYAESVVEALKRANLLADVDRSSDTLGKKILNAHKRRVPYMLILGPKEAEAKAVSVRDRNEHERRGISLEHFISRVCDEVASRRKVPYEASDFVEDNSGEGRAGNDASAGG
jgi:threonyl-tRNA synthetase